MRFIGRRDGISEELVQRMALGRRADRAERADHAVRRLQLRRARRDPRRRAALHGRHRGGVPRVPVRARDARPRPDHPHERRAAAVELPAVAVGLLRAGLPRRAVAGLHARGARASRSPSSPSAAGASAGGDAALMASTRARTPASARRTPPLARAPPAAARAEAPRSARGRSSRRAPATAARRRAARRSDLARACSWRSRRSPSRCSS